MMEDLIKREEAILKKYAVKSSATLGRKFEEALGEEDFRLPFQKDKDRIVHSKAFRRMDAKTQVFMAGSGDHYRTRLTHSLEVAQVARDIARRLLLNEDLCESIALAHDLGHPPFGHAGEEALNEVMKSFGNNFEHNEQSLRVVTKLEKAYPNFDGLNLSVEVIDGLIKHQTAFDQAGKLIELFPHLEAQVVNVADEIAYINHDMDDGLRSGLINMEELGKFEIWVEAKVHVDKKYGKIEDEDIFVSRIISHIIALMIDDFCKQTEKSLEQNNIVEFEDVKKYRGVLADFSPDMRAMIAELRKFLFSNFYMSDEVLTCTNKGKRMIKKLFEYYNGNLDKFPKKFLLGAEDSNEVVIKDYIAGMTDIFLLKECSKL
jgi:dGTPase